MGFLFFTWTHHSHFTDIYKYSLNWLYVMHDVRLIDLKQRNERVIIEK